MPVFVTITVVLAVTAAVAVTTVTAVTTAVIVQIFVFFIRLHISAVLYQSE